MNQAILGEKMNYMNYKLTRDGKTHYIPYGKKIKLCGLEHPERYTPFFEYVTCEECKNVGKTKD